MPNSEFSTKNNTLSACDDLRKNPGDLYQERMGKCVILIAFLNEWIWLNKRQNELTRKQKQIHQKNKIHLRQHIINLCR